MILRFFVLLLSLCGLCVVCGGYWARFCYTQARSEVGLAGELWDCTVFYLYLANRKALVVLLLMGPAHDVDLLRWLLVQTLFPGSLSLCPNSR